MLIRLLQHHRVKKQNLCGNLGLSSHSGSPPLKYETAECLRWKLQVALVSVWNLTNNAEEAGANRDEKAGSKPRGLGQS